MDIFANHEHRLGFAADERGQRARKGCGRPGGEAVRTPLVKGRDVLHRAVVGVGLLHGRSQISWPPMRKHSREAMANPKTSVRLPITSAHTPLGSQCRRVAAA